MENSEPQEWHFDRYGLILSAKKTSNGKWLISYHGAFTTIDGSLSFDEVKQELFKRAKIYFEGFLSTLKLAYRICKVCKVNALENTSKYCPKGHGDPDGKNEHRWINHEENL